MKVSALIMVAVFIGIIIAGLLDNRDCYNPQTDKRFVCPSESTERE